ncbi:metal dependent phosphohydrolase [Paenibacillus algicola]|uniref:Metal dependent phosphohydrolase n=1 Tax=Paenibacillus algicola TaxID=2565926 RepID=A0A4P8XLZ0_9BACL|nr:HD domain-containing phosphohydrolase [Paenibacillus algicola]QCT01229.1 metal dependent phosphohydrolase [Paenibacillus algicola]
MQLYKSFLRQLIRNYMIGSLIAVLLVGGALMTTTLNVSYIESFRLLSILGGSFVVMLAVELFVFFKHIGIIRSALLQEDAALDQLEAAYLRTHRMPSLAVYRIYGPHLLGMSIPALIATVWMIHAGLLSIPLSYIWIAVLGAVMVASCHAMIEFFLTVAAIRPIVRELRRLALIRYGVDFSLEGHVFTSIRTKFLLSAMLIGTCPLFLFSLAVRVHMGQFYEEISRGYWGWAGIILMLGVGFAYIGALLMTQDVNRPLRQLYKAMDTVKEGRFIQTSNLYSDEFSSLIAGFNMMVRGLQLREERNRKLLESYFAALAAALDARDPYTAGHSLRVAEYSVIIGQLAGLNAHSIDILHKTALLHDIGKIGLRDSILLKEGRLTEEEFFQVKTHPAQGENILKQIEPPDAMAPFLEGVRSHHERYDGHGYPDGLQGKDIPLFGRIIAVADAYDAMTSDRPYRRGMSRAEALDILEQGRGSQWDPDFAGMFVQHMRRNLETA